MRGGSVEQPYHATICVLVPSRQALLFGVGKPRRSGGTVQGFCLFGLFERGENHEV